MGGSNCAVVGCGCCSSRHKGVSFHTFPKSGRNNETEEWRRRLINAVCLADKSFNPDTETGLLSAPVTLRTPVSFHSHNLCVKQM